VERNRSARLAVLGSPVPRSRPAGYSSRIATALRRRIVAGVLVLVSVVLITVYFREPSGGTLHGVQSVGATVLRPFEVGANHVAQPFRDVYGYLAGLIHAKSQNARLRRDLDTLRQQAIQNSNAAQENAILTRELGYVRSPRFPTDYDYVATDVIGRPQSEFDQQITIGAGSSKLIRRDDAVVTPDGLVGKVTEVAHDTARVTLLTDPSVYVSALDHNTTATGLVSNGQSSGTLALTRVDKSQRLRAGDLILTQHWKYGPLSGLYPAGIVIGTLTGASQNDTSLFWQAQIRPAVDFSSLQSVLVLIPKGRAR
jgi:rod shape-determining protein MreC